MARFNQPNEYGLRRADGTFKKGHPVPKGNKHPHYIHGHSKHRIHRIWEGMKARCDDPNNKRYASYGGRGISYDPKWSKFVEFLKDMGLPPDKKMIDRIDNNQGYYRENCRWATNTEQARNRRNNRIVEYKGKNYVFAELAEKFGITQKLLFQRIERDKLPLEEALTRK